MLFVKDEVKNGEERKSYKYRGTVFQVQKEEKYVDELIDPNDKKECTGYVEFIQDGAKVSYKPYLKCGNNYQTEGYDENNLN